MMLSTEGPSRPMTHGPNPKPHPPAVKPVPSPFEGRNTHNMPNMGPGLGADFYRLYTPGPYTKKGKI